MNREKKSEKLTRLCAYCAGPMPPPAPTGRPRDLLLHLLPRSSRIRQI